MNIEQALEKSRRYEQYLELDSDNTLLLIQLGDAYHAAGQFDKARSTFEKCLALESDNEVAKSRLASVLLSEGSLDQAAILLTELLKQHPDNPVLRHNLAICQFAGNQLQEAKSVFLAQQNDPQLGRSAGFYLASILQMEDRLPEALGIISQLLDQQQEPYLLGYQSTLLYMLDRIDEALAVAKHVLTIDQDNADACSTLGTFYAEQLETELATDLFRHMTLHAPADVRGWHGLGLVKMHEQDLPGAIEYFERTTRMVPDSIAMWNTLAWAYFNHHRYQDAEASFSRVLEIDHNNSDGWGGLACALAMQKKIEQAEQHTKKALLMDRSSFAALFAKSLLVALKGNEARGKQMLTKVLEQPIRPGGEPAIDLINRYMKKTATKDRAVITSKTSKKPH
ncbi:tetratricopeptide repeat protein [Gynuella sp.]|uniref:tetratricopeptide repeat protein n=1 Tax=Gynuella sp. TaxID=2969146 RepID=UPI003D13925D